MSEHAILIEGLRHRYPGADEEALAGVDLCVPEGVVFGLLGPNGAGKTTLLSVLTGTAPLQRGRVRVAGRELPGGLAAAQRGSAIVPQDFAFYPSLSALENLEFFGAVQGLSGRRLRDRVEACVALAGLERVARRRAATYSGGLKRRLNFAVALLGEPRLLFLDEPTVGVDPQSRRFLLEGIRAQNAAGTTVVYCSHYMEEVQQISDRLAVLDRGRVLVEGALDELLGGARGRRLELELRGPLEPPRLAELQRLAPCEADGARLSFDAACGEPELRRVLEALAGWGHELRDLRYGFRDLEDLFLSLTHRSLRD